MDAADFSDDEFMQAIDFYASELITSSTKYTHELAWMNLNLKTPDLEDEKPSRYAFVDDADMKRLVGCNQEEHQM